MSSFFSSFFMSTASVWYPNLFRWHGSQDSLMGAVRLPYGSIRSIEPRKTMNVAFLCDPVFNVRLLCPPFSLRFDSVYTAVGADWQVYIICLYTLGSDILDPSETVYSKNWYLICFVGFFLRSRDLKLRSMVYFCIMVR